MTQSQNVAFGSYHGIELMMKVEIERLSRVWVLGSLVCEVGVGLWISQKAAQRKLFVN